jgi:hypothetical protein
MERTQPLHTYDHKSPQLARILNKFNLIHTFKDHLNADSPYILRHLNVFVHSQIALLKVLSYIGSLFHTLLDVLLLIILTGLVEGCK